MTKNLFTIARPLRSDDLMMITQVQIYMDLGQRLHAGQPRSTLRPPTAPPAPHMTPHDLAINIQDLYYTCLFLDLN